MAVRTLSPRYVAFDEVGPWEAESVAEAAGCGVNIITTIHAPNISGIERNHIFLTLRPFIQTVVMLAEKPNSGFEIYRVGVNNYSFLGSSVSVSGGNLLRNLSLAPIDKPTITA